MVFEIEIAHRGDHRHSYYLLSQEFDEDGGTALVTRLDNGKLLDSYGSTVQLYKGQSYRRQVRVSRNPEGFEFPPVQLTLKSKCETDQVTVPLHNFVNGDGTPSLKWLEPCPSIEWAAELKRDQSFLVNTLSTNPSNILSVTIFNPHALKNRLSLSQREKMIVG